MASDSPAETLVVRRRRPLGWRIAKWVAIVLAALVALAAAFLLWLNTEAGHRFIVDRINNMETTSGLKIRVGRIEGSRFVMRVRHGYSNGLTRLLYGGVTGRTTGSRVEGEFRTLLWVVLILRFVWFAFLGQALLAPRSPSTPVLLAAFFFLVLVEIVGRSLGDADERKMRDHLKLIFVDVS